MGILAGIGIAAALSLLVVLRAEMALFLDIMIPGMLLGAIVRIRNATIWEDRCIGSGGAVGSGFRAVHFREECERYLKGE
jgi:hypothetical protein